MKFYNQEWASVLRCIALFLGINHAPDKLDFTSESQLQLSLLALCIGLWWFFDQSYTGLGLTSIATFIATVFYRLLEYIGLYRFGHPAMHSWLPFIFFSGAVTVGIVGRQLAKSDILEIVKVKNQ